MAAGLTCQIKGLDKVLAGIDKYSQGVKQGIDDMLTAAAFDTTAEAKILAPIDDSNLRQNIGFTNQFLKKSIYSNAAYSAYLEFGTGANVDVPIIEGMDLPAYAMTFFVNGKGHIRPHPFFFPALQANTSKIPELVEKVLQNTQAK